MQITINEGIQPLPIKKNAFAGKAADQFTQKEQREAFIVFMENKQAGDASDVRVIRNHKTHVSDNLADAVVLHKNMLDLLHIAHNHNYGVALTTETLLYTVMCEVRTIKQYFKDDELCNLFDKIVDIGQKDVTHNIYAFGNDIKAITASIFSRGGGFTSDILQAEAIVDQLGNQIEKISFAENSITKLVVDVEVDVINNWLTTQEKIEYKPEVAAALNKYFSNVRFVLDRMKTPNFLAAIYKEEVFDGKIVQDGWFYHLARSFDREDFYDHVSSIPFTHSSTGEKHELMQGVFGSALHEDVLVPFTNLKIIYKHRAENV